MIIGGLIGCVLFLIYASIIVANHKAAIDSFNKNPINQLSGKKAHFQFDKLMFFMQLGIFTIIGSLIGYFVS